MTQIIVKEDSPVEPEDLHLIILKKKIKPIDKIDEELKKQYKLYGLFKEFNPKFYEEAIPLKNALDKLYTSDVRFSSKYNIFGMF